MARGDPLTSPYVYDSGGDWQGRRITITFVFDNTTRVLTSGTVHRDAGCAYAKIYIGLGPDGTPNSSTHVFDLSGFAGDRSFTPAQMAAVGLTTIESVLALGQITAGP